MTKKEALRILIKHSFLLDKPTKEVLEAKIDTLSAADVVAIGTFLAVEKKQSIQQGGKIIAAVDLLIKQLAR